jgi:peptidoglycan/LPS O-acetylase OafA/YrhL
MQTQRSSNFNVLRLMLALGVILSHTYELIDGNRKREILSQMFGTYSLGEVAVNSFFILSGLLIAASWCREQNLMRFTRKRILRIAPGFFVAVVISLIFFAPLGDTSAWTQIDALKTTKHLLLMNFDPPGFLGNPNMLLNGSLWTIHYEIWCYIFLALLGACKIVENKTVMLGLLASTLSLYLCHELLSSIFLPKLNHLEVSLWNRAGYYFRFTTYFLCGITLHLFKEIIRPSAGLVLVCAASFIFLMANKYTAPIANALPLAVLLYLFGNGNSWLAQKLSTTDLSYGTYLYAWPIQQTIIYYISKNIFVVFLLSSIFSLMFAWFSWKLIEQPALSLKRRRDH